MNSKAAGITTFRPGSKDGARDASSVPLLIYLLGSAFTCAVTAVLLLSLQGDFADAGIAIAAFFLAIGIMFVRLITGVFNAVSIISIITYCQFVLFIARPAYVVLFQDSINIFTSAPYDQNYVYAQLFAGIGFATLCLVYSISAGPMVKGASKQQVRELPQEEWSKIRPALITITCIGMTLYFLYILQTGWGNYWQGTLSGRSDEQRNALSSSSGYLYSGLQFATGAVLFLFLYSTVQRRRRLQVLSLVVLTITVFPQIASGSRAVFIPIIIAIIAALARVDPSVLSPRRIVLWLPTLIVLGFVAPRIWRDNLASGVSLSDSLAQALTPDELFGGFLGGLDTAMVDAFAVQISAYENQSLPYLFGNSYLAALTAAVPRAIWPGKPGSIDEYLNAQLFPATDAKGIGFAFSSYSEPTANFGLVGVICVFALFGLLVGKLARAAENSSSTISTFFYIMIAGYVFPLMRGSFTFNFQRVLIPLVPVLIAIVILQLSKRNKERRSTDTSGRPSERVLS
ncbi:O-antigen ligase [Agreia sp. PsM10]|uniref:O-antigen polymerase n=1 Tax=Agreia sp. PsM10 TaxID=3030533 RepID=UPI00263AEF87|nr:O-antigen polymerase [Agreia sp. PsM10]MDN4641339.1 O-antigen ligase [Agreia sp. PsM10]